MTHAEKESGIEENGESYKDIREKRREVSVEDVGRSPQQSEEEDGERHWRVAQQREKSQLTDHCQRDMLPNHRQKYRCKRFDL